MIAAPLTRLRTEGYVVMPQAIDPHTLRTVRERALPHMADVPIRADGYPDGYRLNDFEFSELIDNAEALVISIGLHPKELKHTIMVPKFPHETTRPWHNDSSEPRHVFILYYLQTVGLNQGVLGINGKPIPVTIGDVILMDARAQHRSYANETDDLRLLIRVWIEIGEEL